MMGSLSEEEDQFFDTREDITSVSDSGSDCPENSDSECAASVNSMPANFGFEIWIKNLSSIRERRDKFLKWMGLSVGQAVREGPSNMCCDEIEVETDRIMETSGAVLGSSSFDDGFSSSQSSMSCWSSDARELSDGALNDNFTCRIKNLDDGTEFIVDELSQDGMFRRLREVGSNHLLTIDEFERRLGLSPLVQQAMCREFKEVSNLGPERKQGKRGWLRRLGAVACIVDRQVDASRMISNDCYPNLEARIQKVRVRSYKKRLKEFSALYMWQDIQAHEGSILTMKFSPDGQYLASAGEDGIVRVWQVVESERSGNSDIHDVNPSYVYAENNFSELVSLHADKEKKGKLKSVKKNSDSACVIFPRKVFQISEKPIHEFHGHCGEVLDLSWSRNKHVLSSSVDKTVRLWQVGYDQCQKVFSHNNYVTCVQFNPVDDDYFVSGSIDGKVRIWAIPGCHVVDWTDLTDIVTAVCYRPDGKGAVIGSMTGNCRFYDASDNHLQLNAQICLQSKKKSPCSRITGFQFSPGDPDKLMVTSADSQVRILHGVDVVCKFRGLRNAGSQISASFTSDGMRIVSASEDSNVYVWNYISQDRSVPQAKNNWSCERFFSNNASVAIPWCGMTSRNSIFSKTSGTSPSPRVFSSSWRCNEYTGALQSELGESSQHKLPFSSSERFSLGHGFFLESLPKGTATWPEEKLPPPNSLVVSSAMCKSQYKLLKTSCHSALGSANAWGLVIVTAGWDGRIRSFQNYGLPIHL
ncbi:hypothetical protein QUC31_005147 [Theobroma cacao]|uniref:Transducin/WD40 repeat superfamily protein isoform 1 n=1 Tax=Theobroma cacao TaxID=3641 RepID=A0A061E0A7_THECC|nr:Transducin/WD40 repeat superfamily protein isoform 1 [Theobroma cacao]EOX95660.1 Transducin/WD40 repeat superfamily protein isoform 1 [Theobroma cacao]